MRRVDKPWGYELIWAETDSYVGKILFVRAGHRLSFQFHRRKEETLLLQSGSVRFSLDDDDGVLRERVVSPGETVHVAPGRRHRIEALEDSELIEVSTPELGDVVRLDDDYGRTPVEEADAV